MNNGKLIAGLALLGGAAYLFLYRRPELLAAAGTSGYNTGIAGPRGTVWSPTSPSPAGPTGAGTNPITALLSGISTALSKIQFKAPGNAPVQPASTSGGSSSVGIGQRPPLTAPPPSTTYIPPGTAPDLGYGEPPYTMADPNYAPWSPFTDLYFDVLPADAPRLPDLSFTVPPGFDTVLTPEEWNAQQG